MSNQKPLKKKTKTILQSESEEEEENQVEFELNSYLQEKPRNEQFDFFNYWKNNQDRYPLLFLVPKNIFVKSLQSDVERNNSFLASMVTKKRIKLKSETIRNLLFIRNNLHYFRNKFTH